MVFFPVRGLVTQAIISPTITNPRTNGNSNFFIGEIIGKGGGKEKMTDEDPCPRIEKIPGLS
jgi:hypothetical protein